uniref:glycosyltransferase family 4 protein n=1 Tax=Algoriphagus sp. TaxID=1872435 RepID=UPI004048A376
MKIIVIAANYPHVTNEYNGIFIRNTLEQLAKHGNEIVVIAPQKIHKKRMSFFKVENNLRVYRPTYISFSAKNFFGFNTIYLSQKSFEKSVFKCLIHFEFKADVVYSHFLLPAGLTALKLGSKFNLKVFCTLGESCILGYEKIYSHDFLLSLYNKFEKVFPNNLEIIKILITKYKLNENKIEFIPNGVDTNLFYSMSKINCRDLLNFPKDEKIVLFIGGFIERKGPLRVLEACMMLKKMPKMIFIGSGLQIPKNSNIIFSGVVNHDLLPLYFNACDVFVLPTKNEGMPNVILEAMACNVPIVTSNIEINKVVLKKYQNKKLCKFDDINCIARSIEELLKCRVSYISNFEYTLVNRTSRILEQFQKVTK